MGREGRGLLGFAHAWSRRDQNKMHLSWNQRWESAPKF